MASPVTIQGSNVDDTSPASSNYVNPNSGTDTISDPSSGSGPVSVTIGGTLSSTIPAGGATVSAGTQLVESTGGSGGSSGVDESVSGSGTATLVGGAGDDSLNSSAATGAVTLEGASGADAGTTTMTGSTVVGTTYAFGDGTDAPGYSTNIITDFTSNDHLYLNGYTLSGNELVNASGQDVGSVTYKNVNYGGSSTASTVITMGGTTIKLIGVTSLTSSEITTTKPG